MTIGKTTQPAICEETLSLKYGRGSLGVLYADIVMTTNSSYQKFESSVFRSDNSCSFKSQLTCDHLHWNKTRNVTMMLISMAFPLNLLIIMLAINLICALFSSLLSHKNLLVVNGYSKNVVLINLSHSKVIYNIWSAYPCSRMMA